MNAGLGLDLARARLQEALGATSRPEHALTATMPAATSRCLEVVSGCARELVRVASVNGYAREDLVRLIETLW
jgi:hypothetical protein